MAERQDLPLPEAIRAGIAAGMLDVHTALPGTVIVYDPIREVATVQPAVRRALEGQSGNTVYETLPQLPDVMVACGAGLSPGDKVLIVFSEADAQQWEQSGALSNPGDLTRHGLGSPFLVPLTPVLTIGNPLLAQFVALQSQLVALKTAIDAAATAETGGGGMGGMNALKLALDNPAVQWPAGLATSPATKLKAA